MSLTATQQVKPQSGRAPGAEYERGVCQLKQSSPSLSHAINRAWLLLAARRGGRMGVYHCALCRQYHVTHIVDGTDTVACVGVA